MFNLLLYITTVVLLIVSYYKDRGKTKQALMKALKSFLNILPDFAVVLALIGLVLTYVSPPLISKIFGSSSGVIGMIIGSAIGAITLIPGFIAFPLAASLLARGAGLMQIAVFISTLMMVGIVTMPLEIKYFGRRATYWRNGLAFLFSFVIAWVMGVVLQ